MTKAIEVNGVMIGSGLPKVCVPLTGKDKAQLLEEAAAAKAVSPELVEWRADFYEDLTCREELLDTLRELRKELEEIPLIFTIRTLDEGGIADISMESYETSILAVAETGCAELIDVEAFSGADTAALVEKLHETGVKVIASTHDFQKTDDSETLKKRFSDMNETGADILKMAVMPKEFDDVAALMQVTKAVTEEYTEKPVISMAMGNLGSISRIAGENFGSAVTFATVGTPSAPGQFAIQELRMMMRVLHQKNLEDK